ncbi:O-methyltransferase [Macleaya cordata]|uniref:O-methyltransferase n=1 Tax=Macleaya cordata TaxID=56857 RepID=A0A200QLM8_MACCD|nr:O-methyltransferase [Macleaya cordata]
MEIQLGDQEQEMKWQGQVWNHICGSVDSAVLKCTIELGLLDIIHSSPKPITLSELSSSPSLSSLKAQNLYRLLRYLSHMNLITSNIVEGNETFSLTDLSKLLLKNQERSLKDWVLGIDDEHSINSWHELSSYCCSPDDAPTPFVKLHGKTLWELAEEVPEVNELINNGMACDTRMVMPAFIKGCEKILNGITKLVDIGGGTGAAISYVVKAFPQIKGTVFDLPHVVATAPEIPGVEMVGGDMFECIPSADALLLKFMLHNWKDDECIKLLKRCKETIPTDQGKVIIIEMVLDQDEDDDDLTQARLSLDLDMMLSSGGKERTKDEWRVLLETAGFSRIEFIPIFAIQSVIVAYP